MMWFTVADEKRATLPHACRSQTSVRKAPGLDKMHLGEKSVTSSLRPCSELQRDICLGHMKKHNKFGRDTKRGGENHVTNVRL